MSASTSLTWKNYKRLWEELPLSKSPTDLKSAMSKVGRLRLESLFDQSLADPLRAALEMRGVARHERLKVSLWKGDKRVGEKRYRHDPERERQRLHEELRCLLAVLSGLVGVEFDDPWVHEVLVPAVEVRCQGPEEREVPTDAETVLRQEARALLTHIKPSPATEL